MKKFRTSSTDLFYRLDLSEFEMTWAGFSGEINNGSLKPYRAVISQLAEKSSAFRKIFHSLIELSSGYKKRLNGLALSLRSLRSQDD